MKTIILLLLCHAVTAQVTGIFEYNRVQYKTLSETGKYVVDTDDYEYNKFVFYGLYANWCVDDDVDVVESINIVYDSTAVIEDAIVYAYNIGDGDVLFIPEDGSFIALYFNLIGRQYVNAIIFSN